MSILHSSVKRSVVNVHVKNYHEEDTDLLGNICRTTSLDCEGGAVSGTVSVSGGEVVIAGANMEAEKRIRREIANSNERRRMQSINAGFQSLRTLLPHHEGEKLSKAAILQQTAEYIYNLEQEKTRLLSQNCQLMRQVQQHEGDVPPKKRIKNEHQLLLANTSIESSDEGLGSMSPEPISVQTKTTTKIINEINELRRQLERERTLRVHLEEQIRTMTAIPVQMPIMMETQIYHHQQQQQQLQLQHTDTIITTGEADDDCNDDDVEMQLIQAENVPLVGQTETVVCCSPTSPMSRCSSPAASRSASPEIGQRLPSALEAAIKAEPKVEVEHLPISSSSSNDNCITAPNTTATNTPPSIVDENRLYVANNTSRQNLETIVEAIRHLEGDHLFSDEPSTIALVAKQQDVPLALTTTTAAANTTTKSIKVIIPTIQQQQSPVTERLKAPTVANVTTVAPQATAIKVEMNHYLQFHNNHHNSQQQQQSRPGVIVVKQHS